MFKSLYFGYTKRMREVCLGVAQFGRVPGLGPGCWGFKSLYLDQFTLG